MDNKKDRQFYWEVKDFMGRSNVPPTPAPQKPNVMSSVKNILEQNKLYKQSSFNPNINSANTIRQAISAMETIKSNGTPNTKAFTKNIASNPFKVIKEGVFDDINAEIENYAKQSGMSPSATPDELEYQIGQQKVKPGVPLTQEQKATRDLQGALVRKQAVQQQMEKEARVKSGQTKIDPKTGNEFSPKPQFVKDREQASQQPKPATPGVDTEGPPSPKEPTTTQPQQSSTTTTQPQQSSTTTTQPQQSSTTSAPKDEWNWRQHTSDENKAHGRQVEAERNRADAKKTPNYYSTKDQMSGTPTDHALAARNRAEQKLANGEPLDANDKFYFQNIGKGANNANQNFTTSQGQNYKGLATSGTKMTPEQIQAESQKNIAKRNTPAIPGKDVEGPAAPTSGTSTTPAVNPGAVRGPGATPPSNPASTPAAPGSNSTGSGQGTSLGLKISDGVPSTPPPQTGGEVNAIVREQLGLGAPPEQTPPTSPGQEGARITLGLGPAPANTSSEETDAQKKARQTLMSK